MPRRRTISCGDCGFMQLKRDEYCEQCGSMTARAKTKMIVGVVYFAVMGAVAIGFYFYIQTLAKNII